MPVYLLPSAFISTCLRPEDRTLHEESKSDRDSAMRVLASVQGNYSFTRFLTFTSLVQLDTSNTQAMSANVRLRYNYRPDSDFYIIYNVGTQFASIAPANPPQVRETRFAVKYTYSFSP